MIKQISREEVFSRSRLADNYISGMQSPSYDKSTDNNTDDVEFIYEYEILEGDDDTEDVDYTKYSWVEEGSLLADLNDHTKPVHDGGKLINDFAVLGYSKRKAGDYLSNRSKALIRFFEIMHIRQLYLMDEKRYDWLRFPFRSQEKLAVLKSWVNEPSYREAFKMDIDELEMILPLFHYSYRHSMPIIILIPPMIRCQLLCSFVTMAIFIQAFIQ